MPGHTIPMQRQREGKYCLQTSSEVASLFMHIKQVQGMAVFYTAVVALTWLVRGHAEQMDPSVLSLIGHQMQACSDSFGRLFG